MGKKKKRLKGLFQEGEYEVRVPKFPVPKLPDIPPRSKEEKLLKEIRKLEDKHVRRLKRLGVPPFFSEYPPPPKPAKKK